MAVVPYTFAGQSGQIPLAELDANFANVKAFAETAGNVTGNTQSNITAVGTLTSLTSSGNVTAPLFLGSLIGNVTGNINGNITGNIVAPGANNEVLFNDNGSVNASPGMRFFYNANAFYVTGSMTTANIRANNFAFANIFTSLTGEYGVANGVTTLSLANTRALTTWITGDASNVYIANVNSVTRVSGNLTTGGYASAAGNVIGANLFTVGQVSAAGNITAGNLSVVGISTLTGVSTAPTAANGTNNTQIATTAFVTNSLTNLLPSGVIVMWSGTVASIPTGWLLCNGANGTPDLRDRFIVGAGNTYTPGNTGGSANAIVVAHTHTASSVVSDPGHSHNYIQPVTGVTGQFTANTLSTTTTGTTTSSTTGITVSTTVNSTGSSGTNANLPPYYALAYIMKA